MIVLEGLIVLALVSVVIAGIYVGVRALARTLRVYTAEHAEWRPVVRTEAGWVVYRVERPGDEPQEVGRVATSADDLEDTMLDFEVRSDALADALNRGRRR